MGLQALFSGSEEAPDVPGLGIIEGQLKRFDETQTSTAGGSGKGRKSVPCIGWNSASLLPNQDSASGPDEDETRKSFYGLEDWRKYYYVHSYFAPYSPGCELERQGWTVATAKYGDETYAGAIGKGNVFATQFHPEKSGEAGLRVIEAFLEGKMWTDGTIRDLIPTTESIQAQQDMRPESSTNGLTRRIIACLDVRTNDDGDLIVTKGDQYDVREKTTRSNTTTTSPSSSSSTTPNHPAGRVRNLGKPVTLASKYYAQSADEITFLNITSFRSCPLTDLPMLEILRQTSLTVFVPLTIGGGIRSAIDPATGATVSALDVAKLYFASGADKVSIGSDAVIAAEEYYARGEKLSGETAIETISSAYGCQAVVVSVDPKRVFVDGPASTTAHPTLRTQHPDPSTGREWVWYQCTTHGGRKSHPLSVQALVLAVERMGAGEILLNAIDRDGTNSGFDLELVRAVKEVVAIPVIASSGAGRPEHFEEVFRETRADAAVGAGIFHRGEYTVGDVKGWLGAKGMVVRRD